MSFPYIDGFYESNGNCIECDCNRDGIDDGPIGKCDLNGKCTCSTEYDGNKCDSCATGYNKIGSQCLRPRK